MNTYGVLFEYDPGTSTYTVKHHFDQAGGMIPYTLLTEVDGKLWGTTTAGGNAGNNGVLFQYDPATSTYTKKYEFDNTASSPGGEILRGANGKLYILSTRGAGEFNAFGAISEYDIATNTLVKKSVLPPVPPSTPHQ